MYEEDDTVFRDIDIKPAHTLDDLEAVIHSSYNLPLVGNGSFYMSNDNWQKVRTIPAAQVKEEKKGKTKMQAIPTIVSFIDDPHQHFIYEYKGTQEFLFLIELMSVGGAEDFKTTYPVCVRSQGPSPFKKEDIGVHFAKHVVPVPQEDEEEEAESDEPPLQLAEPEEEIETEDTAGPDEKEDHDLMDGDAIEEVDEDEGGDEDFAAGDDFIPDDLSEGGDDFEEDEIR